MFKRLKSVLFVICAFMAFTAQANRPDDKGQQHAQHAPAAKPQGQARPQAQTRPMMPARREAPVQAVHRQAPVMQSHTYQPARQQIPGPRVYAVPTPAPQANNRLFGRQHHKNWQPRYNYYDNQYHFYPYVNIATTVEMTTDCVSVGYDGQTYYFDQGTFYVQDSQGQYEAVAPPVGLIVNALPANARKIEVGPQVYFRYKGVFYVQVAQGYQVIGPVQPVPADT